MATDLLLKKDFTDPLEAAKHWIVKCCGSLPTTKNYEHYLEWVRFRNICSGEEISWGDFKYYSSQLGMFRHKK